MEWSAAGIVLSAVPYGEGDALAAVFTEAHGVYRGLARGGLSRARAGVWQAGNLVEARWVARLSDQLGSFSAELVHPSAALAMHDPMRLAVLSAACAVAEGALPEREAQPRIFGGLLHLIVHLADGASGLAPLASWELALLAELGYGLDLSACAVSGVSAGLAYVSPRTGRAVSEAEAGAWRDRLLPLPAFLRNAGPADAHQAAEALRLTAYFLAKNVFGARHAAMPAARTHLADRVVAMTGDGSASTARSGPAGTAPWVPPS